MECRVASLAIPVYLPSAANTAALENQILIHRQSPSVYSHFLKYFKSWPDLGLVGLLPLRLPSKLASWDHPLIFQYRREDEANSRVNIF